MQTHFYLLCQTLSNQSKRTKKSNKEIYAIFYKSGCLSESTGDFRNQNDHTNASMNTDCYRYICELLIMVNCENSSFDAFQKVELMNEITCLKMIGPSKITLASIYFTMRVKCSFIFLYIYICVCIYKTQ